MDSAFVKSYMSFVGMLVSAKPEYLTMVLEKVASGLTYRALSSHAYETYTYSLCNHQNPVCKR